MIDLKEDIRPLSDFKRNTADIARQMKKTKRPVVLTVNGKAAFVIQDAAAYQEMLEAQERVETLEGIRRGLEQMRRNEGRPATEVFAEMRQKFGLNDE